MRALLDVVLLVLDLYQWIIIGGAVLSWLIAFDVVNPRSDFVRSVWNALNALTEPALRPIRRILPALGGLDLSPVVLLVGLYFLQRIIVYYLYPIARNF